MIHHECRSTVAGLVMVLGLCACGSSNDTPAIDGGLDGGGGDAATQTEAGPGSPPAPCAAVVKDSDCDKTLRPFVFVHGTFGSGDNFAHVAALLGSNGYCQDRIVAVEYNSLGDSPGNDCAAGSTAGGCGKIDAAIDKVLAANPGFTQVDLAGHSQGTLHCTTYLGLHANKVAHYINFSGVNNVGNVQTLSLSSMHDLGNHANHATGTSVCTQDVEGGAPVPLGSASDGGADAAGTDAGAEAGAPASACNVIQVTFTDQDHFAVAASKDSFIQVYKYLTGKQPKYTEVQCGDDPVTVEGLSETFADNVPVTGKLKIYELSDTPRVPGPETVVPPPDATGHFGPILLKRNVSYEMVGYDAKGKLVGYQYFSPFKRTNRLVRMLTPASASDGTPVGGLIASMTTDHAVRSPNSVTIAARWAGGAFRQDLGASLKIDDAEVLTSGNAGAGALATTALMGGVVGLFLDDANKNGKTDLGLPTSASFIAFTDVFIDATTPKFVTLSLTAGSEETSVVDSQVKIANWPSSQGLVSVTFQ